MTTEHKRRSGAMGNKRWYAADALGGDLTNRHHHLRAESEEEVERRMRKRYPGAAILVYSEESWRQRSAAVAPDGPAR
jgi:hypothetical protein